MWCLQWLPGAPQRCFTTQVPSWPVVPRACTASAELCARFAADVMFHIFSYLEHADLVRCCCVSHAFRACSESPELWSHLCRVDFGDSFPLTVVGNIFAFLSGDHPKLTYMRRLEHRNRRLLLDHRQRLVVSPPWHGF